MLIAYHGYGDTAAALQEHSGLGATADRSGFVAVFPQGLSDQWAYEGTPTLPGDERADLAFFAALISRLRASGCIDMQRVYLAGSSNGGGEANALACRYASDVAAIMIVSGEIFVAPCVPERPVPVVLFHAFGDSTVLYGGGLVAGTSPSTPPIEDTAAAWATNNGCVGAPDRTALPNGVTEISWTGCDGPVLLYRLPTAGHGWPGAATDGGSAVIDLNAVGWEFLSHFAR